jgi:hypothetical protein
MIYILIVVRDKSLLVKIRDLLSLVLDTILSNRLFRRDRLFESSSSKLSTSKRVLISSSINILIDLVTKRV